MDANLMSSNILLCLISVRLFPVAPYLTRALDKDIELNGYRIPRGKMIVMSLYSTGRNEKYFKSAESFRPERWMRNKKDGHEVINSYAYLPFGLGTRSCIGRRVAEVQMQLLLARVSRAFNQVNEDEHLSSFFNSTQTGCTEVQHRAW